MVGHLRRHVRGEHERGAALPLALGFLVMFGVLIGVIFGFASSSFLSNTSLNNERNGIYAASSAIDAAIEYARSNPTVGTTSDPAICPTVSSSVTQVNGVDVTVCTTVSTDSGDPLPSTSEPGFAILTLAPFTHYWSQNSPQTCSTISTDQNAELGIMQFQNRKLLKVTGNVYVNSDVDADDWVGGCPQVFDAKAINVDGKVKVRESCHDIFAGQGFTWNCDQNGQTDSQTQGDATAAGRTNPPGPYGPNPNGSQPANDPDLADPAIANPASWAPMITAPPAVVPTPACGATSVVAFTPGTYNDAGAMSALTNGSCANKVLWFQPGVYYFDFANSGSHEWAINDGTTRVVGGKPNGVSSPAQTIGPTTWLPTTATSTSFTPLTFGAPAQTIAVIDGNVATATLNSTATRTMTVNGFTSGGAIPGNAVINAVTLRVSHSEPTTVGTRTVTVTPSGGAPCAASTIAQHTNLTEDALDVTTCLNTPSKLSGGSGASVLYSVACSACTSASTAAARIDGMALEVTYTIPARPAWDGTPTSVDAASPSIPGSCRHDGDSGWGETDGVQFVFGGDSHVNLTAGRLELCNMRSSTHQEIVVYGVKGATGSPTTVGPRTWTAQSFTNGASGFTNATNGRIVDGTPATAQVTSGTPTRTMTLTQFSPSTWAIPGADQVPANATITSAQLAVTHWESNTTDTQAPQINVTPFGASACGSQNLNEHSSTASNKTDTVNLLSCLNTPSKLNGGVSILFTARRNSNSPTESLDGMALSVTYTVPPTGGGIGTLTPQSGCITQRPYYDRSTHTPGAAGACALIRVHGSASTGAPVCDTTHVCAALWGTVYAPSAALDIQPDVLPVSVFGRGVVARMLVLGYNIQNDALVPISVAPVSTGGTHSREMTFTATIPGTNNNTTQKLVAKVCIADGDEDCVQGTKSVLRGQDPPGVLVKSWTVIR